MIPELGHFLLWLALGVALVLASVPLAGAARARPDWMAVARPAAVWLFAFVALSFVCLTAAFVGLIDGLVRRDVRRFGAGRESGFIYHRAKASLMPLAVLPWVTYLALPISVHPLLILLPSAALLGLAVSLTAGSFKKYL